MMFLLFFFAFAVLSLRKMLSLIPVNFFLSLLSFGFVTVLIFLKMFVNQLIYFSYNYHFITFLSAKKYGNIKTKLFFKNQKRKKKIFLIYLWILDEEENNIVLQVFSWPFCMHSDYLFCLEKNPKIVYKKILLITYGSVLAASACLLLCLWKALRTILSGSLLPATNLQVINIIDYYMSATNTFIN